MLHGCLFAWLAAMVPAFAADPPVVVTLEDAMDRAERTAASVRAARAAAAQAQARFDQARTY